MYCCCWVIKSIISVAWKPSIYWGKDIVKNISLINPLLRQKVKLFWKYWKKLSLRGGTQLGSPRIPFVKNWSWNFENILLTAVPNGWLCRKFVFVSSNNFYPPEIKLHNRRIEGSSHVHSLGIYNLPILLEQHRTALLCLLSNTYTNVHFCLTQVVKSLKIRFCHKIIMK